MWWRIRKKWHEKTGRRWLDNLSPKLLHASARGYSLELEEYRLELRWHWFCVCCQICLSSVNYNLILIENTNGLICLFNIFQRIESIITEVFFCWGTIEFSSRKMSGLPSLLMVFSQPPDRIRHLNPRFISCLIWFTNRWLYWSLYKLQRYSE